ncbi:MAG: magnesium chelatase, partial [Dehalococcoidia bacterium]|nr:magnesium chelatase [Dehalococcoidia bacterium]
SLLQYLDALEMTPQEVREHCRLDPVARDLRRTAMNQMRLSARGFCRVLKLARIISDLAGDKAITSAHVTEALPYRPRARA